MDPVILFVPLTALFWFAFIIYDEYFSNEFIKVRDIEPVCKSCAHVYYDCKCETLCTLIHNMLEN